MQLTEEKAWMQLTEEKVMEFILENFLFTSDSSGISKDTSFLEKGIIDSTGILEIVGFLEEKFGIKVEDSEIIPENLDSVNNISSYINKKKG